MRLSFFFTLLALIYSSGDAKSTKSRLPYAYNCGGSFYPVPNRPLVFTMGEASAAPGAGGRPYKDKQHCLWTLFGDGACKPAVSCATVDLRPDKCETEFVRVSDALGGGVTACGKDNKFGGPERHFVASKGGRDIFIEFKSHDKPPSAAEEDAPRGKGFHCEVRCDSDVSGQWEPLPEDEDVGRKEGRCVCGIAPSGPPADRIVNGEDADEYEFPWLAAIVKKGTRKLICGASILNNRYILTAAHCFGMHSSKVKPREYDILLHAHLLSLLLIEGFNKTAKAGEKGSIRYRGWDLPQKTDQDEKSLRFPVEEVIVHSEFKKNYDYDVALIRVAGRIPLVTGEPQALVPICLPRSSGAFSYAGANAIVAGWGVGGHDAGATTRLLQKLQVPVLDTPTCISVMPKEKQVTPRMLCAGYLAGGKDSCQGDSGGPLIVKANKSQFKQIGVVSFGESCAKVNRPGIYTNLQEVSQWVAFHANFGRPTWCIDEL